MKTILCAFALLFTLVRPTAAQTILGSSTNEDVYIQANGVTYLRITSTGLVYLENGAKLAGDLYTTGDPDITPPSGAVRIEDIFPGDGSPRAALIIKRLNSSPVNGDGAEYLIQIRDDGGHYGNIAGVIGRLVDVGAATMRGRMELAVKDDGTYNTTFDDVKMVIEHDGRVGIGKYFKPFGIVPGAEFHIATGASGIIQTRATADSSAPYVRGQKARGTLESPTKALNGDDLWAAVGQGWQEISSAYSGSVAAMIFRAREDFTSTAQGTKIVLGVTPTGSTARADQMTIQSDAWTIGTMVGAATTGHKYYLCIDENRKITSQSTSCQ